MEKIPKYIHFHNDTDLPIMVDSWIDNLSYLQYLKINPGEKIILHSSLGEWQINSMFENYDDRKIWIDKGLGKHTIIGKFRSYPSEAGIYSWLEDEDVFQCVYSKINCENNQNKKYIKGFVTFSQKNKLSS